MVALLLTGLLGLFIHSRLNRFRRENKQLEMINARLNEEIAERKQMETALQTSEEKYRSIIENSIDVHYRADMRGKLTMVNPSGVKLLKYENAEEMLGKDLAGDLYYKPEDRERFLAALKKYGKIIHFENKLRCKDGQLVDVEVNSHLTYDEKGNATGVEGMIRDITARKQAEEENIRLQNQLLSAKKMEAVGTLAGGMAHEFNNLMAVILGNSHMLMERVGDNHSFVKAAKAIVKAADRSTTLTNQLLSFSKKQMLKLKEVNLNDLVTSLNGSIRRVAGDGIELVKQLESGPGRIKVDAELMRQVIIGIVENATDAMPGGGTLTIRSETAEFEKNCCDGNPHGREGHFVCLSIADTGVGMDEETRQHMFEPFFTTKKEGQGTGLDLSFVYGTVTQHDGWLHVISAPGKGTTMKVYLPVFK
jgi:PAS domain S-box-containing protein